MLLYWNMVDWSGTDIYLSDKTLTSDWTSEHLTPD
jgi:hypothetical protein